MNKITVKEFVEGYNKCVDSLKNRYIQEKLSILSYLPVNIKDAIAIIITDRTMFEQEKYTDENGEIKFDYNIQDGRCVTTNAKMLLKMAGIVDEIE